MIFERVKEEIRGGRSIVSGIATGYKRGFAAIVDANVVTFMTAFILFALATAEVKGFALHARDRHAGVAVHGGARDAGGARRDGALAARQPPRGARRRASPAPGWTFDFMGASKWFFSLSGTILLIGALAIGGKGLNFGIDFKSGHADPDGVHAKLGRAQPKSSSVHERRQGYPNAAGAEVHRARASAAAAIRSRSRHSSPTAVARRSRRRSTPSSATGSTAPGHEGLLRAPRSARRSARRSPTRDHRDHRLAAGDLRLHRAALRVEVRGAGADRADARPADHRRRVRADRPGSDDRDGRGAADDPRVLAVRHDHRVRPCARERAAHAAAPRSRRSSTARCPRC